MYFTPNSYPMMNDATAAAVNASLQYLPHQGQQQPCVVIVLPQGHAQQHGATMMMQQPSNMGPTMMMNHPDAGFLPQMVSVMPQQQQAFFVQQPMMPQCFSFPQAQYQIPPPYAQQQMQTLFPHLQPQIQSKPTHHLDDVASNHSSMSASHGETTKVHSGRVTPTSELETSDNHISLGHGSTVGSPEEFWCAPSSNNSSMEAEKRTFHADPACVATIADLRKEKTDRSIRTRVLRLPVALCQALVTFFSHSVELVEDLCMNERGIIVAYLVERLGAEGTQPLLQYTEKNFMRLSLNQSGCIALPRILSCLKGNVLERFFNLTMSHIYELIEHPFGNYIVKHFVGLKDPVFNQRIISEYFAANFVTAATNKFGSHVLEDVLRVLTAEELYPVARAVFSDMNGLKILSNDRFANYCIQTMFRTLANGDSQFHSWCVGQIVAAVHGSPYEQNIMKSAVAGYRGKNE